MDGSLALPEADFLNIEGAMKKERDLCFVK